MKPSRPRSPCAVTGRRRITGTSRQRSPRHRPAVRSAAQCEAGLGGGTLRNGAALRGGRARLRACAGGPGQRLHCAPRELLAGDLFAVILAARLGLCAQPSGSSRTCAASGRRAARRRAARAADRNDAVGFRGAADGRRDRADSHLARRAGPDGANYVREELRLEAGHDSRPRPRLPDRASISPAPPSPAPPPDSPILAGDRFFGFACTRWASRSCSARMRAPSCAARCAAARQACPRTTPRCPRRRAGGQPRRGFQAYLENERATPFRTFPALQLVVRHRLLHALSRLREAVDVIQAFDVKLVCAGAA